MCYCLDIINICNTYIKRNKSRLIFYHIVVCANNTEEPWNKKHTKNPVVDSTQIMLNIHRSCSSKLKQYSEQWISKHFVKCKFS